ncbi:hypothetical protein GGX14DRAFT_659745 [Mycena pura]|uniref:Uncharacterized protein n=1 Tax=Mycena pura TaxID=153505 RepID=A0AAD6V971_9AGAR|nr:hypothetical protein GGX14DRAFT_659745 [Mycena pura]
MWKPRLSLALVTQQAEASDATEYEEHTRRDWVQRRAEIDVELKELRAGPLKGVKISRQLNLRGGNSVGTRPTELGPGELSNNPIPAQDNPVDPYVGSELHRPIPSSSSYRLAPQCSTHSASAETMQTPPTSPQRQQHRTRQILRDIRTVQDGSPRRRRVPASGDENMPPSSRMPSLTPRARPNARSLAQAERRQQERQAREKEPPRVHQRKRPPRPAPEGPPTAQQLGQQRRRQREREERENRMNANNHQFWVSSALALKVVKFADHDIPHTTGPAKRSLDTAYDAGPCPHPQHGTSGRKGDNLANADVPSKNFRGVAWAYC